jgi:hypothetical protein
MRRNGTICAFGPFYKQGIISLAGVPESNPKETRVSLAASSFTWGWLFALELWPSGLGQAVSHPIRARHRSARRSVAHCRVEGR